MKVKVRNYKVGEDGTIRRIWLTVEQRDYLKILVGTANLVIAMLIFMEVYT